MMNQYTAVIKQDGDWWIGWIEEVGEQDDALRLHRTTFEDQFTVGEGRGELAR